MNINDASKILSLISDPNRLVVVTLLVKNRKMRKFKLTWLIIIQKIPLKSYLYYQDF